MNFDQEQAQAPDPATIPPLRTFRVVRDGKPDVEVRAHSLQFAGNVIQFVTFAIIDGQPGGVSKRGFNGWSDYEDITPEPSGIIAVGSMGVN